MVSIKPTIKLGQLAKKIGAVLNGDPAQTDLYADMKGGLNKCINKLVGIEGISICKLEGTDIVRNDIIAKILNRLNDWGNPYGKSYYFK